MTLEGPEYPTRTGNKAQSLVILLHGLGADGNDLIELAPHLSQSLPNTYFVAPNAPFPCDMAPFGRQWFSLQNREEAALLREVEKAAPIVSDYVEGVGRRFDVPLSRIALVGFSQGSMMSLHVAPRLQEAVAGVLAYSGALVAPSRLKAEKRSNPPICLVHGEADSVVPFFAFQEAMKALQDAGMQVEGYSREGLEHGIDPAGLAIGEKFLEKHLV